MALISHFGRNIGSTYQQILAMHHALNLNLSVVIIGLKEPNIYISELSKLGAMAVAEYLKKDKGYLFRLANKEEKQTVTEFI